MVHFTAICKLCLGCDGQITCNPSRRIWGLLWVRRRKDHIFQGQPGPGRHTGPSKAQVGRSGPLAPPAHDAFPGVRSLAGPHPPGMIMLPQAEGSVRFKTLETTRVTEPLGLPGTAPSLCRVLGHLSEAPGNSVCHPSVLPQMLRPPPQGRR